MKKTFLLLIASVLLLISCGPKKVVESKYKNGNPIVVKYYDRINGKDVVVKEVVYYENKEKKMEGEYEDMKRKGQWTAWYNNGKVWSIGEYKEGKRNGPGIVYHPNGRKYIESFYTNDEKTGKWRFFDTTGLMIKEVNFDSILKTKADTIK